MPNHDSSHGPRATLVKVLEARRLSTTGYELTLERPRGFDFKAGQLVVLHGRTTQEERNYTICSGERDDFLQVVFRIIPSGKLTPRLVLLKAGDTIPISGPFGEFVVRDPARPLVFIATGTGIAPARSYARSHANLDLMLLHGVRRGEDLFYRADFANHGYAPCVSGEDGFGFRGRVTEFFPLWTPPAEAHFYLCGSNEMFYEMRELLSDRGIGPDRIFTEAYYYHSDD